MKTQLHRHKVLDAISTMGEQNAYIYLTHLVIAINTMEKSGLTLDVWGRMSGVLELMLEDIEKGSRKIVKNATVENSY